VSPEFKCCPFKSVYHSLNRIEKPKKKAEDPEGHFYSSLGNIIWPNVLLCALGHVAGLYGFYLGATVAKWPTLIWSKKAFNEYTSFSKKYSH
jgi:hypothetical protein